MFQVLVLSTEYSVTVRPKKLLSIIHATWHFRHTKRHSSSSGVHHLYTDLL